MWKYAYISAVIILRDFIIQPILVMCCAYCGSTEDIVESEESIYPYCSDCSNKDKIYTRGAAQKNVTVYVYVCMYFLYFCLYRMYQCSVYAYACVCAYFVGFAIFGYLFPVLFGFWFPV